MPTSARALLLLGAVAAWLGLAACAPAAQQLNSDRIAAKFGSYDVAVLSQDDTLRVSSLASQEGDQRVTRTLALVLFEPQQPAYADLHQQILAGASIGRTFRDAGWHIRKPLLHTGRYRLPAEAEWVAELMQIPMPAELAMHAYRFEVSRASQVLTYAVLIELHHPDYLDTRELVRIYGSRSASGEAAALSGVADRVLSALPAGAGE